MDGVIIECCGLPGCGKSSLVKECLDKRKLIGEKEFYRILSKRNGALLSLAYCFSIRTCIRDTRFLFACRKHALAGEKARAVKAGLKLLRFNGLSGKTRGDCLLSEGYLQALLEIMDRVVDDGFVLQYALQDLQRYRNRYYILISADPAVSMVRIQGRSSAPNSIDFMDEEKRSAFLQRRDRNTVKLFRMVQENVDSRKILMLDGLEPLENNVIKMEEYLDLVVRNE